MFTETTLLSGLTKWIPYYTSRYPTQVWLCTHTILSDNSYRAGAQIVLIQPALPPPAVIINEVFQYAVKKIFFALHVVGKLEDALGSLWIWGWCFYFPLRYWIVKSGSADYVRSK